MGYESAVFGMNAIGALLFTSERLPKLARSLGNVQLEYEKARIQVKRRDLDSVVKVQTAYAFKKVEHNQAIFGRAELDGGITATRIRVMQGISEKELRQSANNSLK